MKIKKIVFSMLGFLIVSASVLALISCFQNEYIGPEDKSILAGWTGEGTDEAPYLISSAADLQLLATNVNAGTDYSGCYFLQTANINLSGISNWTPIGNSEDIAFEASYNGNYYTISNMKINSSASYIGLFGYTGRANIRNIVLTNCSITGSGTSSYAGGIAGCAFFVRGCSVSGSITAARAAGIVGYLTGFVDRCSNSATIQGTTHAGGIIAGQYALSGTSNFDMTNCYNTGTVTASGADSYAGGLAGNCNNGETIKNCYNTAKVVGGGYVGGIAGYCYNFSINAENCFNVGQVTCSDADGYVGGVVGYTYATPVNNYYGGSCTASYGIGYYKNTEASDNTGTTKLSTITTNAKSTSWTLYSSWDFTNIWTIKTAGSTYPTLKQHFWSGKGTQTSPYLISSLSDLLKLVKWVNEMEDKCDGLFFKQTANISLSSVSNWIPIGNSSTSFGVFSGVYDGGNFQISNMTISSTSGYIGLFGSFAGTVKNLKLNAFSVTGAGYYVGGLVGTGGKKIENCVLTNGTVTQTSTSDQTYSGGIVGRFSGTMSNCSADITINRTGYTGGTATRLGGLVGFAEGGTIQNCEFSGSITSTSGGVGGILGYSGSKLLVDNCVNKGTLDASGTIGGIAGVVRGYTSCIIQNCVNKADIITTRGTVGGIAGSANGIDCRVPIRNCINEGDISGSSSIAGIVADGTPDIQQCVNTGNITASSSRAGGILGSCSYNNDCNMYDCYNTGNITADSQVGGIAGYIYGFIYRSYNIGTITAKTTGTSYVGGVLGYGRSTCYVQYCYNTGAVLYTSSTRAAGVMGTDEDQNTTYTKCNYYGGNCSLSSGVIPTSSSCTKLDGIINLAKSSSWYTETMTTWDFSTVWTFIPGKNEGYPMLQWQKIEYDITFNVNGGTIPSGTAWNGSGSTATKKITYGTAYGILPTPTLSGYTFTGWYTSTSYTSQVIASTTVTNSSAHTLYAKWTYTITYKANNGSGTVPSSVTKTKGTSTTLPTNSLTRTGFTANGWNTSSTLKSTPSYASGASYSGGNVTLYANWNPISVNVTVGFKFEDDIVGNTYEAATKSGFYYYVGYYTTTISGSTTTSTSKYISCSSSSSTAVTMRGTQTINLSSITCPTGWVCVGYELNGTKYFTTSSLTSKSLSIGTSATTFNLLFKKVSENRLEYQ